MKKEKEDIDKSLSYLEVVWYIGVAGHSISIFMTPI